MQTFSTNTHMNFRLSNHVFGLASLLCVTALPCLIEPGLAQTPRPIPLQSKISRVQPMTGIVLWSSNEKLESYADSIALEFRYVGYNEVVNAAGQYDFAPLDALLDEIASRNHQAVLRFHFCYVGKKTTVPDFIRTRADYDETIGKSENKRTHFCDWSNQALQDFTLDFYTKLAERYDSDPRIAFLQTGFGLWAEYHIYDGPRELGKTFPTKEFQSKFLRHLDKQFTKLPWSISVDAADYDYTPLEDNKQLLALEFGLFDDSFLCEQHPQVNASNWKTLDSERWRRQPGGGEFSYYNDRDQKYALRETGPNGVSFEDAAEQFHISYMIGDDQPTYQPVARIKAASMATGYRFRVTAAVVKGDQLELRVTNEGVAPIYRDAYFSAGTQRSGTSLRGLQPGAELSCSISPVTAADLKRISIVSDFVLPTQAIEFNADLR